MGPGRFDAEIKHCQLVNKPTLLKNIIDLVLCNDPEMVTKVEVLPTIILDHNLINFYLNIISDIRKTPESIKISPSLI